jgi:hypothetical protein
MNVPDEFLEHLAELVAEKVAARLNGREVRDEDGRLDWRLFDIEEIGAASRQEHPLGP